MDLKFYDFVREYLPSREKLCNLMIRCGIFADKIECPECKKAKIERKIKLDIENLWYECSGYIEKPGTARVKCDNRTEARVGTILQSELKFEKIIE